MRIQSYSHTDCVEQIDIYSVYAHAQCAKTMNEEVDDLYLFHVFRH